VVVCVTCVDLPYLRHVGHTLSSKPDCKRALVKPRRCGIDVLLVEDDDFDIGMEV
jgi:hypothetical protein